MLFFQNTAIASKLTFYITIHVASLTILLVAICTMKNFEDVKFVWVFIKTKKLTIEKFLF